MKYLVGILALVILTVSCKKEKPEYGMTTLKHFANDSLYSYIQIPNAFSADGNGINDVFYTYSNNLDEVGFELVISNKSGQIVFVTNNLYMGWDGTDKGVKAASGKYFYSLLAKDKTGYAYQHKGGLYLLR